MIKELREKKTDHKITNPEEFEQFFIKLFSEDSSKQETKELSDKHKKIADEVVQMLNNPGGIGQEDYSFTYFCRIEKYLIAGTAFLRALLACLLAGFSDPVFL